MLIPLPRDLAQKVADKALEQVLPCCPLPDMSDRGGSYIEHASDGRTFQLRFPNPENIFFREFGPRALFSNECTTSIVLILGVVRVITKQKMGRLNTDRAVARMPNDLPIWYGSVKNFVRYLVSFGVSLLPPNPHAELSVARGVSRYGPIPASFCGGMVWHEPSKDFSLGKTPWSSTDTAERIAISAPPSVVGATPFSCPPGVAAAGDRAHLHVDNSTTGR